MCAFVYGCVASYNNLLRYCCWNDYKLAPSDPLAGRVADAWLVLSLCLGACRDAGYYM